MFQATIVHADDDPPALSTLPDQVNVVKQRQQDGERHRCEGDGSHSTVTRKAYITIAQKTAPSSLKKGFFNAVNSKPRKIKGHAVKVGRPAAWDLLLALKNKEL